MEIAEIIRNIEIHYRLKSDPKSTFYFKVPILKTDDNYNIEVAGIEPSELQKQLEQIGFIYLPIKFINSRFSPLPSKYLSSNYGDYVKIETSGLLFPKDIADLNGLEYTTELPETITLTLIDNI